MKPWIFLVWIICLVGWSAAGSATAAGPLVELGRPGPWAGVSGLIAYGPRLYLVNSQIFINHNAADVYSYHPGEGTLRFEQRLFSQDAGIPAIIDGLLYWPYEDPRFSSTYGEYAITDGQQWWTASPNPAEKYLEPALAAAWAVAALGQADSQTLDALHTALTGDLPDWARGDILAALHRLTGYPFQ